MKQHYRITALFFVSVSSIQFFTRNQVSTRLYTLCAFFVILMCCIAFLLERINRKLKEKQTSFQT